MFEVLMCLKWQPEQRSVCRNVVYEVEVMMQPEQSLCLKLQSEECSVCRSVVHEVEVKIQQSLCFKWQPEQSRV